MLIYVYSYWWRSWIQFWSFQRKNGYQQREKEIKSQERREEVSRLLADSPAGTQISDAECTKPAGLPAETRWKKLNKNKRSKCALEWERDENLLGTDQEQAAGLSLLSLPFLPHPPAKTQHSVQHMAASHLL